MRTMGKLRTFHVSRLKRPGIYTDGGALYLQVASASSKSWIFRFFVGERDPATGEPIRNPKTGRICRVKGHTRDMGLGAPPPEWFTRLCDGAGAPRRAPEAPAPFPSPFAARQPL